MERFLDHFRDEHIGILKSKQVFSGMTDEEIRSFMQHADPEYIYMKKGESLRVSQQYASMMGLVMTGRVHLYSIGYDGTKTLIRSMEEGETSGMMFYMLDYQNTLVELIAFDDSEILLTQPENIFVAEHSDITAQHKILVNLISSQRNLFYKLTEHIACLSQRTLRGKILRFLKYMSDVNLSYEFDIPMSREELADYLAVDRASLSRSLSELRDEGVINVNRRHFRVNRPEEFQF